MVIKLNDAGSWRVFCHCSKCRNCGKSMATGDRRVEWINTDVALQSSVAEVFAYVTPNISIDPLKDSGFLSGGIGKGFFFRCGQHTR